MSNKTTNSNEEKKKETAAISPYKILAKADNVQRKINLAGSKIKRALDKQKELNEKLSALVEPIKETPEYKMWLQVQEEKMKKAGSKS